MLCVSVCLWKKYPKMKIYYNNKEDLTGQTLDSCKDYCESVTKYDCVTFDYFDDKAICFPCVITVAQANSSGLLMDSDSGSGDLYACGR